MSAMTEIDWWQYIESRAADAITKVVGIPAADDDNDNAGQERLAVAVHFARREYLDQIGEAKLDDEHVIEQVAKIALSDLRSQK